MATEKTEWNKAIYHFGLYILNKNKKFAIEQENVLMSGLPQKEIKNKTLYRRMSDKYFCIFERLHSKIAEQYCK